MSVSVHTVLHAHQISGLCYDNDGNTHDVGAGFVKNNGCAKCSFDTRCMLHCVPSNEPHCGGELDTMDTPGQL